ncbi:hypothetical protein [Nocardioides marmoraquaticus]
MAGKGGRPKQAPEMRCNHHPGSRVGSIGTYETESGTRRRYRCVPKGGDIHSFSVVEGIGARVWSPPPPCPRHVGSRVVRNGTYGVRTPRPRQRYRCTPADGSKPHAFTPPLPRDHVHASEGGCPECEELRGFHHGETAVARRHSWPTRIVARALTQLARGGSYADTSRQALRTAERTAERHDELVSSGLTARQADAVVEAEEAAADRGEPPPPVPPPGWDDDDTDTATETAVLEDRARYRRRRRTKKQIADDAAKAAAEAAGEPPPDEAPDPEAVVVAPDAPEVEPAAVVDDEPGGPGDPDGPAGKAARPRRAKNPRSAESHNVWHIAADWCEAFSPVIYEPVATRLREAAVADRARLDELAAAGASRVNPQVLLLDDIPVYGRAGGGKSRRDEGFFLLVAAEVEWGPEPATPFEFADRKLRLRLVRAMPKSNAAGWRLVLDELGYDPDFVVADAGTGIARAIESHYDPTRTVFVPSLWHVAAAVRAGLADTRGALVKLPGGGKEPLPELRTHLGLLSRETIATVDAWSSWWDQLEDICRAKNLPLDRIRRRRRNYEPKFATAISALAGYPHVPVSTGGLETVMARQVQPLLALRRTGFGNLERTNRLFDLVVAREHGAFDELTDVVNLLRADASTAGGWTVPLRDVSDPRPMGGRYSSLRDNLLITEIAESRGLA